MKLLLDTCTFIWLVSDPDKLSELARQSLANAENELWLSVISSWEIALKAASGSLQWSQPISLRIPHWRNYYTVRSLALTEAAVLHQEKLPAIHRDPFDRVLICQALTHGLVLVTPDREIRKYQVQTIW